MNKLTREMLVPGASVMFQTRANGALTIDRVDSMYVHFKPEFNGEERTYSCENIEYTLTNALLWAPVEKPWSLRAGKEDDGEVNWKVDSSYPSLDQLLADLPTVVSYPYVEVSYMRPDGRRITDNFASKFTFGLELLP